MPTAIRPAAVAGMFYPAEAGVLAREVDRLLAAAGAPGARRAPRMIVVPHAGYVYSGAVAARAYAQLAPERDRIRRVVVLGPTHRVALRGMALPAVQAFETPLGRVALATSLIARLCELPQVGVSDAAHAQEHAIEVQLPFLQRALGSFELVPVAVGDARADEVAALIDAVWDGDETLVVVSTDLSHYLPYAGAQAKDRETVAAILRLEPVTDHYRACGATPLAGALVVARERRLAARLLDLRNSGDTAGDRSRVVGYCAIALDAPAPAEAEPVEAEPIEAEPVKAELAAAEQEGAALGAALLGRARNAIARKLGLKADAPEPSHPELDAPGASFVTLHRAGRLRGCIGSLAAERPLADDVREHAVAAAFRDSRFAPLAAHEFAGLEIEVSVVGPSTPLAAASEREACALLRPGTDGVTLEWRGRRATFLPQVWEQLPRPEDFVAALKHKAGLAAGFWADDLRLERYAVRRFDEAEQSR